MTRDSLTPPGTPIAGPALRLRRRGVDHGTLVLGDARPPLPEDPITPWQRGEPLHLPGAVAGGVERFAAAIAATLGTFDALREGARFLDEIDRRLSDDPEFRYAGSTVDHTDRREIERIFVDVPGGAGRRRIRDLTLRLSFVADDERDRSLRIRFSFGHESTRDWLAPDERALWSDELAERVFPECGVVTEDEPLLELLGILLERPFRLSERIVYSNAPGGGAVFHHDADPGQRGVCFTQLHGRTVWLALPKRELATHAAACAPAGSPFRDPGALLEALDGAPDPALWELLNATPALTLRLSRHGRLFRLEPGDVLLLPSHDAERVAWHSVFGVGNRPSLAHSYGLFDALALGGSA